MLLVMKISTGIYRCGHSIPGLPSAPLILSAWEAAWILAPGFVHKDSALASITNSLAKQFGGNFAGQAIPFDSLDKTISSEQRSLSHEFNAPLTKVFGETDILKWDSSI